MHNDVLYNSYIELRESRVMSFEPKVKFKARIFREGLECFMILNYIDVRFMCSSDLYEEGYNYVGPLGKVNIGGELKAGSNLSYTIRPKDIPKSDIDRFNRFKLTPYNTICIGYIPKEHFNVVMNLFFEALKDWAKNCKLFECDDAVEPVMYTTPEEITHIVV